MVHLRVADIVARKCGFSAKDYDDFIIGNVAPDSGKLNDDRLTYNPPKSVTHFKTLSDGSFDLLRYENDYLVNAGADVFALRLGYYSHLLTDTIWKEKIYYPTKEKYHNEFMRDKLFVWRCKRDWYDLDKLFLKKNPGFKAYESIRNNRDFCTSAFDYLRGDLIRETINRIADYYDEPYERSANDEYVYMTEEEMTDFVICTASAVEDKLTDFLKVPETL